MSVTAETLFREWFLPLYRRTRRATSAVLVSKTRIRDNVTVLAHLDDAAAVFATNATVALGCPTARPHDRG